MLRVVKPGDIVVTFVPEKELEDVEHSVLPKCLPPTSLLHAYQHPDGLIELDPGFKTLILERVEAT